MKIRGIGKLSSLIILKSMFSNRMSRNDNAREYYNATQRDKRDDGIISEIEYFKKKLSNSEQIKLTKELKEINGSINLKTQKMEKTGSPLKSPTKGDDEEIVRTQPSTPLDPSAYDNIAWRTFIVLSLTDPLDRVYKSLAGLKIMDIVINVEVINQLGCERVIVVHRTFV